MRSLRRHVFSYVPVMPADKNLLLVARYQSPVLPFHYCQFTRRIISLAAVRFVVSYILRFMYFAFYTTLLRFVLRDGLCPFSALGLFGNELGLGGCFFLYYLWMGGYPDRYEHRLEVRSSAPFVGKALVFT
jgi:hypothetical protein